MNRQEYAYFTVNPSIRVLDVVSHKRFVEVIKVIALQLAEERSDLGIPFDY